MKKPRRFLVPSDSSGECPPVAIYHVVTRVVDRRFVLEAEEKEQLRVLLRMYDRFSGCRFLSYLLMSNYLHVLLEVPPGCEKRESLGLSEEELLRRLGGLYSRNYTASVAREIEEAKALISLEYRKILISAGMEQGEERGNVKTKQRVVVRKGMDRGKAEAELARLSEEKERDLKISKVIQCRVRYFTDGAVIGSKSFVDGVFQASRERFGPKRKDGARKPRGALGEMAGEIWSLRDLKEKGVP
jgi:REP element-mobilizing transposase RayT